MLHHEQMRRCKLYSNIRMEFVVWHSHLAITSLSASAQFMINVSLSTNSHLKMAGSKSLLQNSKILLMLLFGQNDVLLQWEEDIYEYGNGTKIPYVLI